MLEISRSSKFKSDYKNIQKRGYDTELLKKVISILAIPEALEQRYKPHPLTGNYAGFYECHISPDWLLIYRQTDTELQLFRTGTHSDLFR